MPSKSVVRSKRHSDAHAGIAAFRANCLAYVVTYFLAYSLTKSPSIRLGFRAVQGLGP